MKKLLISVVLFFVLGFSQVAFSQDQDVFTIVYNNIPSNNDLKIEWGFSVWIRMNGNVVLFDTGTKPDILQENLKKLKLDLEQISVIAISHEHGDHTGGLESVLKEVKNGTKIYLPNDFNPDLKTNYPGKGFIVNDRYREIADGVWLTEIFVDPRWKIREQALVLVKEDKLLVITGCAHPDIVGMCDSITKHFPDKKFEIVTGGFHLMNHSEENVIRISNQIKDLGFKYLAPSHCNGENSIAVFKKEWDDNFVQLNLGDSYVF